MNQRQGFSNHNQQNRFMLPFDGQKTNTVASQIEDQAFALRNQPVYMVQNGQWKSGYGEPVKPPRSPQNTGTVFNLLTDNAAQQVATTQLQEQHQQTYPYYQNQWQAQQQQLEQANYQEYLRQCSQSAMLQSIPVQVPISTENGQKTDVIMHFPLWALTPPIPSLFMSSMGLSHQTVIQETTNIFANGQNQQFYAPMQQNDLRNENIVEIQEFAETQQVEEPLDLVVERAHASDPVNRQTIFNKELQQMRSSTVNLHITPGLGNGLINK